MLFALLVTPAQPLIATLQCVDRESKQQTPQQPFPLVTLTDDEIAQVIAYRTLIFQILITVDILVKACFRIRLGDQLNGNGGELVKEAVDIPVIANGDITTAEKSLEVLRLTNANGLMIGRGAQGRPWIFRELNSLLDSTAETTQLEINELRDIMLGHLGALHRFYGETAGVRVARKHLTWYCEYLENAEEYRHQVVRVDSASEQIHLTKQYFLGIEQSGTEQQRRGVQDR